MLLKFSHNGREIPVEYLGTGSGHAVLYAVPKEYSDDGYYVAAWQDTEIEPVPACAASAARVLCRVRLESGTDGSMVLKNIESNEGATCHA